METKRVGVAQALDAADPLRAMRERFHLPTVAPLPANGEPLYLCGHSLGPLPRATANEMMDALQAWREMGVEGHMRGPQPWVNAAEAMRESMARLVGARPAEVAIMNSLTVNLHLMLASFYRPTKERFRILMEQGPFPSDRYAVASQLKWHGFDPATALVEVKPRTGETYLRDDDVTAAIEEHGRSTALVMIGGVNYFTGQFFDLAAIARAAHAQGCTVGFDLAHAIGNVPLDMHGCEADFAIWCNYKYVNGGPGAVGGAFVHERHFGDATRPRLAGWWGHTLDTRFAMLPEFDAAKGAAGWQVSSPTVLALAALRAPLQIFDEAGCPAVRAKSQRLSEFFDAQFDEKLGNERGLRPVTPRAAQSRGAAISIDVVGRRDELMAGLRAKGVVCDSRGTTIRFSFHPLYNSFDDVQRFVEILAELYRTLP